MHNLQKVHDVRVVYPLCHFRQQPVVLNIVKVGAQIKVEDPRLPPDYRLGNSLDRIMSCPLWTSNDPGWKSASKAGSSMSLSAPCTTLSRIAGIERTRTLPHSFGIPCFRAGSGW